MLETLSTSITGNEAIDMLQGVQRVTADLPTAEEKVNRLTEVLPFLPAEMLMGQVLDINAGLALLKSEHRAPNQRDSLRDVEIIGAVCRPGAIEYVESEITDDEEATEGTIKGFAINFLRPVLIGYDAKEILGYQPAIVQLPVNEIRTCRLAAAA